MAFFYFQLRNHLCNIHENNMSMEADPSTLALHQTSPPEEAGGGGAEYGGSIAAGDDDEWTTPMHIMLVVLIVVAIVALSALGMAMVSSGRKGG